MTYNLTSSCASLRIGGFRQALRSIPHTFLCHLNGHESEVEVVGKPSHVDAWDREKGSVASGYLGLAVIKICHCRTNKLDETPAIRQNFHLDER